MLEDPMANLSLTFAPCPAGRLILPGTSEAHVWQIDLNLPRESHLSAAEQERAEAMRHAEKRQDYRHTRSALRVILSKYLGLAPKDLQISLGPQGKPHLEGHDLHFNVTHAQGKALIAIASVPVGIDLEFPRGVNQQEKLVTQYFNPDEASEWRNLPAQEQAKAFLAAWTRKEACLKATGEGIAGGLHRYRVTLRPEEDAKLISIDGQEEAARAWTLHAFSSFGDAQAAICAKSPALTVQAFVL